MDRARPRPAPGRRLRCAVCHDDLAAPGRACRDCGTRLHPECAGDLSACPTLGCGGLAAVGPDLGALMWRIDGPWAAWGALLGAVVGGLLGALSPLDLHLDAPGWRYAASVLYGLMPGVIAGAAGSFAVRRALCLALRRPDPWHAAIFGADGARAAQSPRASRSKASTLSSSART